MELQITEDGAANVEKCLRALVAYCHTPMLDLGWWHDSRTGTPNMDNPLCFSNKLMLIVSEIAEAMEGDRKGLQDDKLPHRPMREVELADALIRIFDLAGAYNMQRADHKLANRAAEGGKKY